MKPDYLQNACTRAEAFRDGQLLDLAKVKAAVNGRFLAPVAMTRALWRALAGDTPFSLDHPLLQQLCRIVVATVTKGEAERQHQGWFSETSWFHATVGGCRLHIKVMCHPGDAAEPVLTLLEGSEESQFEL